MSDPAVLVLDVALARHLAAALAEHEQTLHRCGLTVPPAAAELRRLVTSRATARQGATELDVPDAPPNPAPMTARLLTYALVAEVLSCSVRHVQRLVRDGRLPVVAVGPGTVRVRVTDLEAFVAGLPVSNSNESTTETRSAA